MTKIQLNKFKDQIGFIQRFMNWAASHLTNRRELCPAVEKEMFLKAERRQKKEIISKNYWQEFQVMSPSQRDQKALTSGLPH